MALVEDPQNTSFLDYPAVKVLQQLAQKPVDLTQPSILTPDRLTKYIAHSCGYKLLYGTEKINDDVLNALKDLGKQSHAIQKMQEMQDGAVVNTIANYPSENRAALHTALRDVFDQSNGAPKAQEAAKLAKNEIEKLKVFIDKIDREQKFKEIITIGIGGSDLGPRATFYALEYLIKPGRKVHFISNVDPDDTANVLRHADLKHTLVIVISKSGTTLETEINEDLVRAKFAEQKLNANEHFVSITMPNTPMDNHERYFETFHLWDWVGGRYSVTSMVGGVMLAFAFGFDVFMEFLRGAHAMDKAALNKDLDKNLPLLCALLGIWNHNFLHYPTVALIPYSQALLRYPAHIQQVEMESNGKSIDKSGQFVKYDTGPIIWGEPGTNGQHSFFQMIHQGTAVIPVTMVGYKNSQYKVDLEVQGTTSQEKLLANMFAQSIALATGQKSDNPNKFFPGNRPTRIILGESLNPFSLGALLSLFENQVALEGFILGINSFDQEGVQLGKVLATKIISRFAAKRGQSGKDEAPYPLADVYLKQLDTFSG